jgi:polyadenylate-binding protein
MNNNLQVVIPHNQSGDTGRTVLFVSELPDNITEQDIVTFFQDYKESILMIQINRRPVESFAPKSQHATVIFKDHSKADEARKGLSLRKLRGKTIRVMWHERDNSVRYNNQANLFVKNIPTNVKPREFYEAFAQFGDIVSAKFNEDDEGNPLGYGYVNYYEADSAEKALKYFENNQIWGSKLDVQRFQKKNERLNSLSTNKNLYIKNLPADFSDSDLKNLFGKFGNISWSKVMTDKNNRAFAILAFDNEDNAVKARETLSGHKIGENEIFIDSLMKKSERQRLLTTRINENNFRLNNLYKNCNLHIRNLHSDIEENQLTEIFSRYGEVKSVKIPKFILETKVNNEYKEYLMSKGFGYVCFTDAEAANRAKEELNGQPLPGFENKRPVLVDVFMSKQERKQVLSHTQQLGPKHQMPFINPINNPFMQTPYGNMPNFQKHVKQPMYHPEQQFKGKNKFQQPVQPVPKSDDPDLKILESLEDDSAKKDYLGEFIFRKIENHPLAVNSNFTIDTIGKITGMILGIDDINEIFHITVNHDNLTNRIQEALSLLEAQGA